MHKISFTATYPGLQQRGVGKSRLEMLEESLWTVALRKELREQPPGSPCWVIPQTAGATLLRQSTPLWMASTWGEATALPTGMSLPHPGVLKPHCWLQIGQINNWRRQIAGSLRQATSGQTGTPIDITRGRFRKKRQCKTLDSYWDEFHHGLHVCPA